MRHKAQEGPNAAAIRIKIMHCARLRRSPRHRCARPAASLQRPDRTGTPGARPWHACDGRNTQAAPEAVSDCLRRHAGRHVVWVHGKVAGMGWRARFEGAYHRRGRRGCSGRRLELHLLMLHSTRRRAPREATLFLTCSSSTTSFRQTGFAVAWRIASSRPLRSPIWADGPSAACSRDTRRRLTIIVRNCQI